MSQTNTYSDLRVFGELKAGTIVIESSYSLPSTDGTANQILVTDGAGNITFQDASTVALTPPAIINGTGLTWTTPSPNTVQGTVSLAPFTTNDLAEGGSNLYYQDERVDDRVNAFLINGTGVTKSYNDLANTLTLGVTLTPFSTTNLAEGVNLYYTDERVEDRMAAVLYKGGRGTGPDAISWTHLDGLDRIYPTVSLTPFTTDDLSEGTTNLYLTENSLYDLMDQIIQDSASVTWTRDNLNNQLTPVAATSMIEVKLDGSTVATNPTIDFITTPSITYTINDDIINSKTTIQLDSSITLGDSLSFGDTTVGNLIYYSDAMDVWNPGDSTTVINAAADNAFITKEWFYDNDPTVIIEGSGIGSTVRKDNANTTFGAYATVAGGSGNTASGYYSTIVGGTCNSITSVGSFIGGGANHSISGDGVPLTITAVSLGPFAGSVDGTYYPTTASSGAGTGSRIAVTISSANLTNYLLLALGVNYQVGDTIIIDGADIGGTTGVDDITFTVDSVIDGGSTVAGGFNNDIFGAASSINGGVNNFMCAHNSAIVGGAYNCINGLVGLGDFGLNSVISGGTSNVTCGYDHSIGGGSVNTITAQQGSVIGGGCGNSITGTLGCPGLSVIGGGSLNSAFSDYSTISGGYGNIACLYSTVSGGYINSATSDYSTVSGGYCNSASCNGSVIGGGLNNISCNLGTTVSGGGGNSALSIVSTVGGGGGNTASGYCANTISGGYYNTTGNYYSTVAGGSFNASSGYASAVGGGVCNYSIARATVISGGELNTVSCNYSAVLGGLCNCVTELGSSILGGQCNTVSHRYSSAVGCNITSVCNNTLHANCLNLYDTPISSTTDTAFLVRRSDGMIAYRSHGGLFTQTADGTTVTATVTETSVLGTGVGSLSVPANGFSVGDSFVLHLTGTLSAANNQTLTIKLKSGSTILASSGAITLPTITSKKWSLDAHFVVRAIGAAGVAQLLTSGSFTYNQNSGNSLEGSDFESLNASTFDTTGSNTLSVTVQWGSTNATNSIVASLGILEKVF